MCFVVAFYFIDQMIQIPPHKGTAFSARDPQVVPVWDLLCWRQAAWSPGLKQVQ